MTSSLLNGYSEEAEVPSTFTAKGGSTGANPKASAWTRSNWNEAQASWWTGHPRKRRPKRRANTKPGPAPPSAWPNTSASEKWINPVSKKEEASIFRYYEYATTPSTETTEAASTLKEIKLTGKTELKATEAKKSRLSWSLPHVAGEQRTQARDLR